MKRFEIAEQKNRSIDAWWTDNYAALSSYLESILAKSLNKSDADWDDVLAEAKLCLFKALKNGQYNAKKSSLKTFSALILSSKRVDFIRKKVRNRSKLNLFFDSVKTRKSDCYSVQDDAIFNEYEKKWISLRNQLPETTRLILADIGRYPLKQILENHHITSTQYYRLLDSLKIVIEETIFHSSKF